MLETWDDNAPTQESTKKYWNRLKKDLNGIRRDLIKVERKRENNELDMYICCVITARPCHLDGPEPAIFHGNQVAPAHTNADNDTRYCTIVRNVGIAKSMIPVPANAALGTART